MQGRPLAIQNLTGCDVYVFDTTSELLVDDCTACTFFVAPVAGSAFFRDCRDCRHDPHTTHNFTQSGNSRGPGRAASVHLPVALRDPTRTAIRCRYGIGRVLCIFTCMLP